MSVLQRAQVGDVETDPYPFVVVPDALPNDLCDALISEYPRLGILGVDATQNNSRWSIPALDVSQNDAIARVWKDFVAYHASPAFFDECVRVFGDHVVRLYPRAFSNIDALRAARLGIRDRDPLEECDFFLDAQISGNTPVQQAQFREDRFTSTRNTNCSRVSVPAHARRRFGRRRPRRTSAAARPDRSHNGAAASTACSSTMIWSNR